MNKIEFFQANNSLLRAQLFRVGINGLVVLWIAESEKEVYTLQFDSVMAIDKYSFKLDEQDLFKVLLLIRNTTEDEISGHEIGILDEVGVKLFIDWFVFTMKKMSPSTISIA